MYLTFSSMNQVARTSDDWCREWQRIVQLPTLFADSVLQNGQLAGVRGISLEPIHVMYLASMIRRAIVIFADDGASAETGSRMSGRVVSSTEAVYAWYCNNVSIFT